jgi:N-formylglutamate amidohydrolase
MSGDAPGYRVISPTGPPIPLVVHVPHASTLIPPDVRAEILLDDVALGRELVRMTDWHVDRLLAWVPAAGGSLFVNERSRLVVDPERFTDDAGEPMALVGQGAVYTRTADGRPLRQLDDTARARLLARYFEPYHAAFTARVASTLERFGSCLVLDGHSFATMPLPSEPDQSPDRPDICLGTDTFHTPSGLVEAMRAAFAAEGFRVAIDRPFAGTLVPLAFYRRDPRVSSVMLEVRRGLYSDEATGEPTAAFNDAAAAVERALRAGLALRA